MFKKENATAASEFTDASNTQRNQILASLPPEDLDRLEPHLERVKLSVRDLLFDVNQVIEDVYFPESCVASIIGLMADGSAVETATVGDEGMVGLPIFHGTDRTSTQAFCQVPGTALRLPVDMFRDELRRSPQLNLMLHRYSMALFTLVAQSSACNRLHTMPQRCARWLLHTHDRVGAHRGVNQFPLTQQFLSQMLGVRRATVSEAMSKLQEGGSVAYERGIIQIADRARLESKACECYSIVKSEFERLLADHQGSRDRTLSPLADARMSEAGKTTVGDAVPDEGMEN
jgi:CRP-like cAMP-binding protein